MPSIGNHLRFNGKNVLITGAASGIGHATAQRFGEVGAHVILVDVNAKALQQLAVKMQQKNYQVTTYTTDLGDKEAIDRLWDKLNHQPIDVLINNAGIYPFKDFLSLDEPYLEKVMRVNFYAVVWMCQHMIKRQLKKGGSIVNIGSIEAIMPFKKGLIQYAMSKVGVITLTRDLAREFGRKGFRVNAILPGGIISPGTKKAAQDAITRMDFGVISDAYNYKQRIPAGRLGQPDEVARMIIVLASDMASYVNGALLPVDGGFLSN